MNDTKHTPGPWPIKQERDISDEYSAYLAIGGAHIYLPDSLSDEDAYLLSAAPELLESAIASLPVIDDAAADAWQRAAEEHQEGKEEQAAKWRVVAASFELQAKHARAAIAKATEGAP